MKRRKASLSGHSYGDLSYNDCCISIFLMCGGFGVLVGLVSLSWAWSLLAVVLSAAFAYVSGYHRVLEPLHLTIAAILAGIAGVIFLTLVALQPKFQSVLDQVHLLVRLIDLLASFLMGFLPPCLHLPQKARIDKSEMISILDGDNIGCVCPTYFLAGLLVVLLLLGLPPLIDWLAHPFVSGVISALLFLPYASFVTVPVGIAAGVGGAVAYVVIVWHGNIPD